MVMITKEDYQNPPDKLCAEDISSSALYPLSPYIHASRQAMYLSQAGQMPPMTMAERPMVYHGITDLTDLALCTVVPYDCTIFAIVDNIILCETTDGDLVFNIELPSWVGSHGKFGFKPVILRDKIYPFATLKKGEVLAHPPTMDGMYLNSGVHLNTLVSSYPGTAEDGGIISESAIKKLAYDTSIVVDFSLENGYILTNRYGDEENHLGLPSVGDVIGSDGILCTLRCVSKNAMPGLLSPKALMDHQIGDIDKQSTGIKGYTVSAIEVIPNIHNQMYTRGKHCNQLNALAQQGKRNLERIKELVERRIRYSKKVRNINPDQSPDLTNLMVGATMMKQSTERRDRVKLLLRTSPSPPYYIKVSLYKHNVVPQRGGKLTDRSSAKCTITSIRPDHLMPEGVDIIVAKEASINRVISSRDPEQWINGASVIVGDRVREILGYKRLSRNHIALANDPYDVQLERDDMVDNLINDPEKLNACMQIVEQWAGIISNQLIDVLRDLLQRNPSEVIAKHNLKEDEFKTNIPESSMQELADYVIDIVEHNMVNVMPIDFMAQNSLVEMCKAIENSPFAPKKKILKAKNIDGSDMNFKYPMIVAPIYYSVLDKDSMEISSSAGQPLQVMGLPAIKSIKDKFNFPVPRFPTKILGLDECTIYSMALGGSTECPMGFLELFDRLTSTLTQKAEVYAMLNSDKPSGEVTLVNRRKIPYGRSRTLEILKHIMHVHGVEFFHKRYVPDSKKK